MNWKKFEKNINLTLNTINFQLISPRKKNKFSVDIKNYYLIPFFKICYHTFYIMAKYKGSRVVPFVVSGSFTISKPK